MHYYVLQRRCNMNASTIIIASIILIAVIVNIVKMVKKRGNGCHCSSSHCSCHGKCNHDHII